MNPERECVLQGFGIVACVHIHLSSLCVTGSNGGTVLCILSVHEIVLSYNYTLMHINHLPPIPLPSHLLTLLYLNLFWESEVPEVNSLLIVYTANVDGRLLKHF